MSISFHWAISIPAGLFWGFRAGRYRDKLEALVEERTEELSRLAVAMEQAAETVLIINPQGNTVYANSSFEKVTGYTIDESIDRNVNLLLGHHPGSSAARDCWDTISKGTV